MSHDVRDAFANREREHRFVRWLQCHRFEIGVECDVRRLQRFARGIDFGLQSVRSISAHCAADLCERVARDALDVANFGARAFDIAFSEFRRELGLQHDHGQCMSE